MPDRAVLYRAAWVLPVTSPPIRQGAVMVDRYGRIAEVGPSQQLEDRDGVDVVELGEAALLPGLVNTHTHLELSMFRGALEELPFREWILRLVAGKRSVLGEEDYAVASRWSLVEAIRAGITTLAATEASTAAFGALVESGLRGIVYQEVFGPDPSQVGDSMRELSERLAALRSRETELVRVGISPHAPYTVSDELYRSAGELAERDNLPVAVHIAESAMERSLVTAGEGDFARGLRDRGIRTPVRGESPIEMLDRQGLLRVKPLLIHCVDVGEDDIRRIADSGSTVAHCPIANAKLGHGVAPLIGLREAGVKVGLGTDSVASNNRVDMLEEGRVAALLQRARHASPTLLSGEDLLELCTLDGARALGVDDRVGSLEPGKDADLCAVSFAAPHVRPVHDPLAALFHSARATDVVLTVVQGRVIYRDGRVATIDAEGTERGVEEAAARLRSLR